MGTFGSIYTSYTVEFNHSKFYSDIIVDVWSLKGHCSHLSQHYWSCPILIGSFFKTSMEIDIALYIVNYTREI